MSNESYASHVSVIKFNSLKNTNPPGNFQLGDKVKIVFNRDVLNDASRELYGHTFGLRYKYGIIIGSIFNNFAVYIDDNYPIEEFSSEELEKVSDLEYHIIKQCSSEQYDLFTDLGKGL